MGTRCLPNDAVFMFITRDSETGKVEAWLEVASPEPKVYRRRIDETLDPEIEGIIETMMQSFKVDVGYLVAGKTKDSRSV